jgi:pimeloyl-ACP methyl ester carboxylesterase
VPTLVLVGSHDLVALPEESFEIARLVPKAQIKIIHNAGHNPEAEQSELFVKELSTFITSLASDIFTSPHLYRSLSKF